MYQIESLPPFQYQRRGPVITISSSELFYVFPARAQITFYTKSFPYVYIAYAGISVFSIYAPTPTQ